MRHLKLQYEEVIIGALLGLGTALAVSSPLILLTHIPMPSLLDFVWPVALLAEAPDRWARLPLALVSLGGLSGVVVGGWFAAEQEEEQHLRGTRYVSDPSQAVRALRAIESPRMSEQQRAHTVRGVTIGGVEFSRSRETEHALVLGLPGGGKTAGVLRPLLDQVLARGDRVLLHDPKGDFATTHFDPANTVLLGPWDERSHIWDGAGDMDSPALVDEFAAAVCGVAANTGPNSYFYEGAAWILGGLIKSALREGKRWTWAHLADALLGDPVPMILRAAEGDANVKKAMASLFTPGKGELIPTERNVLSTLANRCRMLLQLGTVDAARPDAQRFSMRGWLTGTAHTDIRLVILNSSALYAQACEAIWGSMLATASATIVATLPERSADEAGLWMILDEARQLGGGALERVQTIEEVGRSRGVRVVLGLQDAQQLEAAVGREKAGPMLSMQATRFYLRSAPTAAEQVVKTVGDREIKRITNTATGGAVQGKQMNYERVPVLTTSDLTGLRLIRRNDGTADIEVVVAIEGTIGKLLANSGARAPKRAEAFVPCEAWRAGLPPAQLTPEPSTPDTTAAPYDNDPLIDELLQLTSTTADETSGSDASDDADEPFEWD
ncbi:type IV secretion system DNA-binding domain-containing protein [Rhodanobacter aciditrophus]|uniref:type IV secretion system DNA-binding domain-containing protein n=1 Tax=Rhodanobacter aciditrophus TaxID=1623218 RepID=UPI003CE78487